MDNFKDSLIKDKALFAAWQRMLDYDVVSLTQKNDFRNFRQLVVWFTWLTTLFGVLYTSIITSRGESTAPWLLGISEVLKILLVILPFLSLAFMNYASQFAGTTTWIEYRRATEMIRAAIYLYRTRLAIMGPTTEMEESEHQLSLIDAVNTADDWIMDNKATMPHMRELSINQTLQEIAHEAKEKQVKLKSQSKSEVETPAQSEIQKGIKGVVVALRRITVLQPFKFIVGLLNSFITFFKTIDGWRRTIFSLQPDYQIEGEISAYDKKLALQCLKPLEIEDYIEERLLGQRKWYVDRIRKDYLKLRRTRLLVIALSLLVSVLSIYEGWVVLVPVAVALGTAFTLLANIDMIGRTYVLYQNSAEELQDRLDQWRAQTDKYRESPDNQFQLIMDVEETLEEENSKWREDTIATQKTNEAAIYRNLQEFVQKDDELKNKNQGKKGKSRQARATAARTE